MPKMNDRDWGIAIVGALFVLGFVKVATDKSGGSPVPTIQTSAQFGGLNVDAGLRYNGGTPLSMDPKHHFYYPGYDPEPTAQPLVTMPHRYPLVTGSNISAIIHRGFDALKFSAPDPEDRAWIQYPPSESDL